MWGDLIAAEILVPALATVIAAAIGFGAIAYQICRQARTAMKQRAYEHIARISEEASDACGEFSNYVRSLLRELGDYNTPEKQPGDIHLLSSRVPRMLELQAQQADTLISAIRVIERWLIIDPRMEIFKLAFNVSFHETYRTFFHDFFPIVAGKMPQEVVHPDKGEITILPELCTKGQLEKIQSVGEQLISELDDFKGYMYDFQVEMQNVLLEDLFKHRAPVRRPLDPKVIVLSIKQHEILKKRLYEETASGQYIFKIEEDAKKRYSKT